MLLIYDSPVIKKANVLIVPVDPTNPSAALNIVECKIYSKNNTVYFYIPSTDTHYTIQEMLDSVHSKISTDLQHKLNLHPITFYSENAKKYVQMPFISAPKKDNYQLPLNFIIYSSIIYDLSPYENFIEGNDDIPTAELVNTFMMHIDQRNDASYRMIFTSTQTVCDNSNLNLHCCAVEDIGRIGFINKDNADTEFIHAANFDSSYINNISAKDVFIYGALVYTSKDLADIASVIKNRNIYYHQSVTIARSETSNPN